MVRVSFVSRCWLRERRVIWLSPFANRIHDDKEDDGGDDRRTREGKEEHPYWHLNNSVHGLVRYQLGYTVPPSKLTSFVN